MGISFSISCDQFVVFPCGYMKGGHIRELGKNLVALESTMAQLKAKRDDVSRRVMLAEYRGLVRLAETEKWITAVTSVENIVTGILDDRDAQLQKLCFCGICSKSLRSSYYYGRKVSMLLREVESLNSLMFDVVAEQPPISEVHESRVQQTVVGRDEMLQKACDHLREDGVGILGLYGMPGVGKTTLLQLINNNFSRYFHGYDFVIWVAVSKHHNMERIQDEIGKGLGLIGEEWEQKDKSEKARTIYRCLRMKKFVLFLDDIWEKVDLAEIGVPTPTAENGCKVAFTTPSREVCARMGVDDPMEVQCLSPGDAFTLFEQKVGRRTLRSDPEIPQLASKIVEICAGLPLALSVIGEIMSCKRTVDEWRHAISVLESDATQFVGVSDRILPILKNRYNNLGKLKEKSNEDDLKDEDLQSFLLYCALLPKDYIITRDQLVDYWICEGIIDGSKGIETAENKGNEIINNLVRESLLMEETKSLSTLEPYHVSMRDIVREMAITSNLGTKTIVRPGVMLPEMPEVENRNVVRRMSCMKDDSHHRANSNECSQLRTLLLRKKFLTKIPSKIFKFMPKLKVLDLSYNEYLTKLPDEISEVGLLQYLNLSYTGIRYLPMGLQRLKKLIHLDLDETRRLWSIDGVSSLLNLKVLKLVGSGISWDRNTVEELEPLENLETLTTGFYFPTHVELFLRSPRLTSCTRSLRIQNLHLGSSTISLPTNMYKLRDFTIWECRIAGIVMGRRRNESRTYPCFSNISSVYIKNCKGVKELTFLMFAPNLKRLHVEGAYELEDIINKETGCEDLDVEGADELEDITNKEKPLEGQEESEIIPFPKLIYLKLVYLPNLKSIYWRALPFPCLQIVEILRCPMLKKLPLDSQSGKRGEDDALILQYGEEEWIKSVEWEDEATETRFLSSSKCKAQSDSGPSRMQPVSGRVNRVNGHSAARAPGKNLIPIKKSDCTHRHYHHQKPLTATDLLPAPMHGSNLRVAYRGVPGAYSEAAAGKAYPNCTAIPCDQFEVAFQAVELWRADRAVLPVENSLNGFIHPNYDLLLRHRLHIVGEVQLPVHHCLLALPGVRKELLKRVISHPQDLAQCERTLTKLGLNVAREAVDDTAGAAEFIAANNLRDTAAIASARAAEIYGLKILEDGIQDDANPVVTRFVMLARDPIIPRTDRPFKTSIVFAHEKGTRVLSKVLSAFARRDISLTKIETRPNHNHPIRIFDDVNVGMAKHFEYMFYLDFEASMVEARAQNVVAEIQEFTSFLRVLGSYPMDMTLMPRDEQTDEDQDGEIVTEETELLT